MNRGSRAGQPRGGQSASFNEAPIHESGKGSRSLPREDRTSRFNEAPIHESGKDNG